MGKPEKLFPSSTSWNSRSKRSKVTLETVRQTDENAAGPHASDNTAMMLDASVEADRETSETYENWQMVTNQRSSKVQKTDTLDGVGRCGCGWVGVGVGVWVCDRRKRTHPHTQQKK